MELTDEMARAFDLIENSSKNLFITGKAGTGKTTFLKYVVENSKKELVVTASTGIAAINAGGTTLHSLFGIPLEPQTPQTPIRGKMPKRKFELFGKLELLIIDEISMVKPDVLDYVDRKLRVYKLNNLPFGGVQVVMFGDPFQLPPVVNKSEREVLKDWYKGHYFFYSIALRNSGFEIVELNKVFRQKDEKFVNILNRLREYKLISADIDELSELRNNRKSKDFKGGAIHICSLKRDVDRINTRLLGEGTHVFNAVLSEGFNPKSAPCDLSLSLREGARVMMLVNDSTKRFCNGSMGTVSKIEENRIWVKLDTGDEVEVLPYTWTEREYVLNKGVIETKEKGSCTQFPLTLGWAITIHKSQGLTFDKIVVHCPYAFAPGMIYVALSRCTSMRGITTNFFIGLQSVKPDNELIAFTHAYSSNDYVFNTDVYRAFCRYLGYNEN